MSRRQREAAAAGGGGGPTSVNPPTIGEMNQFTKYYRNMLFDYGPERQERGVFIKRAHLNIPKSLQPNYRFAFYDKDIETVYLERSPDFLTKISIDIKYKNKEDEPWVIGVEYNTRGVTLILNNNGRKIISEGFSLSSSARNRVRHWNGVSGGVVPLSLGMDNVAYSDMMIDFIICYLTQIAFIDITVSYEGILERKIRKLRNIIIKIITQTVPNGDRQDRRITELEEVNRTLEGTNEVLRNEATTLRERLVRAEEGRRLAEYNLEQRDTIREQNPGEQITATDETEDMVTEGGRKRRRRPNGRRLRKTAKRNNRKKQTKRSK